MNEMSSIGRKEWPGITMVIFRNYQWGAEKRNSILWFDDNFVGTELDPHLSYAKVAEGCGLKGVTVKTQAELTEALRASCEAQKKRVTTFIEVILNQELGEPFRRDAMKKPVVVAGIKREDMRAQQGASSGRFGHDCGSEIAGGCQLRKAVVDELVRRGRAAQATSPMPTRRAPTRRSPRWPGRSTIRRTPRSWPNWRSPTPSSAMCPTRSSRSSARPSAPCAICCG